MKCNINVKYNIFINIHTFFDEFTQFLHDYGLNFSYIE